MVGWSGVERSRVSLSAGPNAAPPLPKGGPGLVPPIVSGRLDAKFGEIIELESYSLKSRLRLKVAVVVLVVECVSRRDHRCIRCAGRLVDRRSCPAHAVRYRTTRSRMPREGLGRGRAGAVLTLALSPHCARRVSHHCGALDSAPRVR